jgi:diguanylate cyclase (GGDEF)-like protein/PAS domain S-box-containing protein
MSASDLQHGMDKTVAPAAPPETTARDAGAPSGASPARRGRFLRAAVMVLASSIALAWLFNNADSVSVSSHQTYSRELRAVHQMDAEVNAAVLATRFELYRNFDVLARGIGELDRLVETLRNPPAFLAESDTARIITKVDELSSLVRRKAGHIERFKRENAVLRNSTRYFPVAVANIQSLDIPHLRTELDTLAREVMTYMVSGGNDLAVRIQNRSDALERQALTLPTETGEALKNVVDHAKVMVGRKATVDMLLHEILEIPTTTTGEQIIQMYNGGYANASRRAHAYRVMLFVVTLGLAAYLVRLFTRLGRITRALRESNRSLEERIDELHRTEANLRLYATVFTSAAEGMVITDTRTQILVANPAFTSITGYSMNEVHAHSPAMLASGRHAPTFYHDMWKTIERRGKWQGEIWNRRKNGEIYPEWLSITAVKDADGAVSHYIGVFSDTTERKRSEAHIHHLAHHDSLTNLPNRLLMQERLNEALSQSRRIGCHIAVLFLNLDRFRNINDTLGAGLGDALLQQVAHRSQSLLRDTDTVARLGSDEFVFILPDINHPQDVAGVARKLLTSISRPYLLGEHDISITASIGIAISDTDGDNAAELLRNADAAMSRAKSDGRNSFRFYSTDMNTSSLGDLLLENQLRGALERNELELHYQPKIDAKSNRLESAEALLRWRHPELGLVPPSRFIPLAEESGLIVPIGEWVLRTACQQIHDWRHAGLQVVPIAINLSAQQFLQNDLPVLVHESLAAAELEPALLELELTESMLMRNIERTVDMLDRLRNMGIWLSIDDFGTGYSSLAYLKQFQVNVLKIDKSFVSDIHNADADGKIAVSIIALAHGLGLKVVAEGVETEDQRNFLFDHGCDIFQGYLFSRPLPAAEFAKKLTGFAQSEAP